MNQSQHMIVPVDGHWLNLMMGKRFHENLNSNSNSENDSTSSYESVKTSERDERPSPTPVCTTARKPDAKDTDHQDHQDHAETNEVSQTTPLSSSVSLPCTVQLDKIPKDNIEDVNFNKPSTSTVNINTHTTRIATMNLEVSKLSTKNIIEHSKILSLQHMDSIPTYSSTFIHEVESSGDETSSRGTLDVIIPPLKDFQGKNNPFLMQNKYTSKMPFSSVNLWNKHNGKQHHFHSRFSLPGQLNPLVGPMIRPMKRKLSEKDIVIGPNGEVKRRKYRRPRKYMQMQVCSFCVVY